MGKRLRRIWEVNAAAARQAPVRAAAFLGGLRRAPARVLAWRGVERLDEKHGRWLLSGASAGSPPIKAVVGVVRRGNHVLALRRSLSKDAGPGLWECVSGRLEPGERPALGAAREIREETGLEVTLDPWPVDRYAIVRIDEPMGVLVFRAEWVCGEVTLSAEHDAYRWWTPAQFRQRSSLTRLADAVDRAFERA